MEDELFGRFDGGELLITENKKKTEKLTTNPNPVVTATRRGKRVWQTHTHDRPCAEYDGVGIVMCTPVRI